MKILILNKILKEKYYIKMIFVQYKIKLYLLKTKLINMIVFLNSLVKEYNYQNKVYCLFKNI